MSLFDYPRIHFKGTIQLNPGTANNDDYAQQPGAAVLPASYGPYAGQVLGLIESKTVQARTFGMSDADFIAWVQKAQTFDVAGSPGRPIGLPPSGTTTGAWTRRSSSAAVIGVQTGPGQVHSAVTLGRPRDGGDWLRGELFRSHHRRQFRRVAAGDPVLHRQPDLQNSATTFLQGRPSKGACQWLNFYRNVNLTADGGAGGYVYHVMRKSDAGTEYPASRVRRSPDGRCHLSLLSVPPLWRSFQQRRTSRRSTKQQQSNPAILEIVGTFAPLFANETIVTGPVGRLLVSNDAQIRHAEGHAVTTARRHRRARARGSAEERKHHRRRFFRHLSGLFPRIRSQSEVRLRPGDAHGRQRHRQRVHRAGRLRGHRCR